MTLVRSVLTLVLIAACLVGVFAFRDRTARAVTNVNPSMVGGAISVDNGQRGGVTCGVRSDARLQCWGDDSSGSVSGPNASTAGFTQVSVGEGTTCGLKTDGHLACW